MGTILLTTSSIAAELLGRDLEGHPKLGGRSAEALRACLCDPFELAGLPMVAAALARYVATGEDEAVRIRSEEWEEAMGLAPWSEER